MQGSLKYFKVLRKAAKKATGDTFTFTHTIDKNSHGHYCIRESVFQLGETVTATCRNEFPMILDGVSGYFTATVNSVEYGLGTSAAIGVYRELKKLYDVKFPGQRNAIVKSAEDVIINRIRQEQTNSL